MAEAPEIVAHACIAVEMVHFHGTPDEQSKMSTLALQDLIAQLPEPHSDPAEELIRRGFIRVTWEFCLRDPEAEGEEGWCSSQDDARHESKVVVNDA